tara:strand:+ start:35918 stop:36862 length:945 start_codon:yes stop_codon:yes gene_type:complete
VIKNRLMKKIGFFLVLLPILLNAQTISSEDISLTNKDIKIPGTLTYIKTDAKIPLVIFVHGSGNIDRNGNQAGTPIQISYIKTLADSLNNRGIAFYSYDKRTATVENRDKLKDIAVSDFADDAKIAIQYFKNDSRFNSINLIGHSQGSLVAMLAITDDIKAYISIAGAGEPIDKIIIKQLNTQNPALGKTAEQHIEELKQTDTIVNVNPFLLSLFAPNNQKFLKKWMLLDPQEEIKKITIPILLINGDTDLQVQISEAENLKKAQPNAKLIIIPKMNHVMKVVNSLEENQQAYSDEKFPISSTLIQSLFDFIKL